MKQPIIPLIVLLCAVPHYTVPIPPPLKQPASTIPAQTEAEKAQAAFTTLIDKTINQYEQQKIKPTSALDQQALQLIKKHPSLLTKDNLQKAFSILFHQTALYIIEHMPDYQGTISDFINVMHTGNIAIFNALFSRIPGTDKLDVDGLNLLTIFFSAIDDFTSSDYPFTAKEKQEISANLLKMLQALIAAGADVNKPSEEAWGTSTPLSRAVRAGDKQIIDYLISVGAKVNPPSNEPLIQAIKTGNLELLRLLIKKGADINQSVNNGSNKVYPLFIVLEDFSHRPQKTPAGITPLINTLLDMGADVNAVSKVGRPEIRDITLLDAAIIFQLRDVAKLLISHGAKPNTQDSDGNTILHNIIEGNPTEPSLIKIINMLLDFKYDLTIKNKLGKTALDLAREQKADAAVIQRLEELAKK